MAFALQPPRSVVVTVPSDDMPVSMLSQLRFSVGFASTLYASLNESL